MSIQELPTEENKPHRLYPNAKYPNNIHAIKNKLNLSIKDLERLCKIGYETLAMLEIGYVKLSPYQIQQISQATGYQVHAFRPEELVEYVRLPKKETEQILFKAFNIINVLDNLDYDEVGNMAHIQEQQGFDITSAQLYDYFKQYGLDIE